MTVKRKIGLAVIIVLILAIITLILPPGGSTTKVSWTGWHTSQFVIRKVPIIVGEDRYYLRKIGLLEIRRTPSDKIKSPCPSRCPAFRKFSCRLSPSPLALY
jgi:hypothetical protein